MIGRGFAYGGAPSDARRLNAHLWKADSQRPELCETRNLYVPDSAAGMRVMRCLQQASNAKIAFWHIIVSPRTTLNESDRTLVVNMILDELKARTHPLLVFSHNEKLRARRGGGACHWHLVLGHISPTTGRALDMSHFIPRLHKVMAVAQFYIEGEMTVSPFHRSIVECLRKEGRNEVAEWLTDQVGNTPQLQPPRMTDAMRRSAAAAGFELASFQARLEQLWKMGALERDFDVFLTEFNVSMRRGSQAHSIVFYRGKLLVGVLNRILRQRPSPVYAEAMARFPSLLDKQRTTPAASSSKNEHGSKKPSRELALKRQASIDILEAKLRSLRWERLQLTYNPSQLRAVEAQLAPEFRKHYPRFSSKAVSEDEQTEAIAIHVRSLLDGEAILETAIGLLWDDDRCASVPIDELLRRSKRRLGHPKPVITPARSLNREGETEPDLDDQAIEWREEDDTTVQHRMR